MGILFDRVYLSVAVIELCNIHKERKIHNSFSIPYCFLVFFVFGVEIPRITVILTVCYALEMLTLTLQRTLRVYRLEVV